MRSENQQHPDPRDLNAWLDRIKQARERIAEHVRLTPVVTSYTFSEGAGRDVRMKLENLQRTGAFKLRGALNKVLLLDKATRDCGMIAASAGNHAQGLALASKLAGAPATIVMPESTAIVKVRRTEDYGATVILHGKTWDESHAHATELCRAGGMYYVHPFDDPDVIAGQGTLALELLEQLPDLQTLVVPIGGGGLIAGMALATKALAPHVRIVGVQAKGADAMVRSFRAGKLISQAAPNTIAEGIRVGTPGKLPFEILRAHVDDCVTVEEAEIVDAVLQTLQKSKVAAETAGVVGVAALAARRVGGEDPVCAVISGGNIDLNFLGRLIQNGLAAAGYYHPLVVRISDRPGQLQEILGVITSDSANIVDIEHRRHGWQVPIGSVDVSILIETLREGQGAQIEEKLRAAGFVVR